MTLEVKGPGRFERRLVGKIVRGLFLRGRRAPGQSVPDWLPHEALRIPGNSGADLAARWFPAEGARSVVVLAHPDKRSAQHWFITSGWVDVLHDAGHHVLTFDFAAYGASKGGSTYFFEDVLAAARYARDRAPDLPIHVVGVSIGAFSVANAAPQLDFVETLVLESPYPTFNAWYGRGAHLWAMRFFDRLFPRTARLIRADANLSRAPASRILVTATPDDRVTPVALSRAVADAGPAGRTTYAEFGGVGHLEAFPKSAAYRRTVLAFLDGRSVTGARALEAQAIGRDARPRPLGQPS